jgi:hypothetical protein
LIPFDNVEFRRLESYKEYYEDYTDDAKSNGKALVNAPELSSLESLKIIFSGASLSWQQRRKLTLKYSARRNPE